jgi:RNA polymerase sigma-70 factor, ECF subfamily
LFHYLLRSLQNESDAADLAQETFVRVYQNRAGFDGNRSFSTWLYTIATNLVRTRFRWRARHPQISLDAGDQETGMGPGGELADCTIALPDESLQTDERADAVRQAVAALPDELRLPLILFEYEEKSQAEIAAILNSTAKTVEGRIHRARQRLRRTLGALVAEA